MEATLSTRGVPRSITKSCPISGRCPADVQMRQVELKGTPTGCDSWGVAVTEKSIFWSVHNWIDHFLSFPTVYRMP